MIPQRRRHSDCTTKPLWCKSNWPKNTMNNEKKYESYDTWYHTRSLMMQLWGMMIVISIGMDHPRMPTSAPYLRSVSKRHDRTYPKKFIRNDSITMRVLSIAYQVNHTFWMICPKSYGTPLHVKTLWRRNVGQRHGFKMI